MIHWDFIEIKISVKVKDKFVTKYYYQTLGHR